MSMERRGADQATRAARTAARGKSGGLRVLRSIVTKNVGLFVCILIIAVVPLAVRYHQDSRDYEIQNLASKLEFFAERGATWIDVDAVMRLERPEDRRTDAYRSVLASLRRIEREFGVDNAVVMRREPSGGYVYLAAGHDGFAVGSPADIHTLFPETYRATNDTWVAAEMMHSELFGGEAGGTEYDQFLQINVPLKHSGRVVAILMLNKFANPVAAAVRAKTIRVVGLTLALLLGGLALFAFMSARMLRPLRELTAAAGEVARGNLSVASPAPRSRDEVGQLAVTFAGMVEGLRQRDFIRDTFGRYVTQEVVDELLGSPDGLKLGGETRVVTILVTDLRGFTPLAASRTPQEVLAILNRYLEQMVEVIRRYRGTIDEIQGDGILAFFGAPIVSPDDAMRAVACALDMQLTLLNLNAESRVSGLPELSMGVGINTGEVIVGNIGSEQRTKYAAVGSAINTAYRIESHTVGGQILIGADTYELVRSQAHVRSTTTVSFKGLDRPLTLYEIDGLSGTYRLALPQERGDALGVVEPPLGVACFTIDGKSLATEAIVGRIVRAGAGALELLLVAPIPPGRDLKIVLDSEAEPAAELYGRTRPAAPDDGTDGRVVVGLTYASEAARRILPLLNGPHGPAG